MTISIIVPAYNAERYLPATIDSIIAQTITDWQLIIVNDGSKDDTGKIADQYAHQDKRITVLHQKNAGLSNARNNGFHASDSSAPYVIFLDSDDLWETDTLEELLNGFDKYPHAIAVYGLAYFIDQNGLLTREGVLEGFIRDRKRIEGFGYKPCLPTEPVSFAGFMYHNWITTPGMALLKRAVFTKIELFGTEFSGCADYDFWIRLSRIGEIQPIDKLVLGYRQHNANMSSNSQNMYAEEVRVRKKFLSYPGVTEHERQLVITGYRLVPLRERHFRLQWMLNCLRQGQIVKAAKHFRHALIAHSRSRQLR